MSKREKILLAALGGVVVCVGSFLVWYYGLLSGGGSRSPEQLAQDALNGATVQDRAEAAVGLRDCGYEARDELRRVLQESDTPEVRAACIEGLGEIEDYDSVDLMFDLLDDDSPIVRASAGSVVSTLVMGPTARVRFKADASDKERKQAIETLREKWEELRDSPLLNRHKRELEKGRENES